LFLSSEDERKYLKGSTVSTKWKVGWCEDTSSSEEQNEKQSGLLT
jgi:hypothetical protein